MCFLLSSDCLQRSNQTTQWPKCSILACRFGVKRFPPCQAARLVGAALLISSGNHNQLLFLNDFELLTNDFGPFIDDISIPCIPYASNLKQLVFFFCSPLVSDSAIWRTASSCKDCGFFSTFYFSAEVENPRNSGLLTAKRDQEEKIMQNNARKREKQKNRAHVDVWNPHGQRPPPTFTISHIGFAISAILNITTQQSLPLQQMSIFIPKQKRKLRRSILPTEGALGHRTRLLILRNRATRHHQGRKLHARLQGR